MMLPIQPMAMRGHWMPSKRKTKLENCPIVSSLPRPSTSLPPTSSSSEIVRPKRNSVSGNSGPSTRVRERLRRTNSSLRTLKRVVSRSSMPKPLTTRMPLKFSCAIAAMSENCSWTSW